MLLIILNEIALVVFAMSKFLFKHKYLIVVLKYQYILMLPTHSLFQLPFSTFLSYKIGCAYANSFHDVQILIIKVK